MTNKELQDRVMQVRGWMLEVIQTAGSMTSQQLMDTVVKDNKGTRPVEAELAMYSLMDQKLIVRVRTGVQYKEIVG